MGLWTNHWKVSQKIRIGLIQSDLVFFIHKLIDSYVQQIELLKFEFKDSNSNELRKTKIDRNFLLGLTISRDGKIKAIHVVAGDKVADEDIILELE